MKGSLCMNFYNPYSFPYQTMIPKTSGIKALLGKINLSSIIGGTQKTLNTVNQIIPLIQQARPMMDNAKTLFKLMSEFNRSEQTSNTDNNEIKKTVPKETVSNNIEKLSSNNGPTFFL